MKHLKPTTASTLASISSDPLAGIRMEETTSEEGEETTEEEEGEEDEETSEEEEEDGDEKLGEPGKKALERERSARKALAKELKELKRQGEDDGAKALREATEAVETRYQGVIARAAFKAELAKAGLKKGEGKLLKLLELEDVVVDEDGEVSGVAEQVRELRKDFPELFGRGRESGGRGDGGQKGNPPEKKLSSAERIAMQAHGEE